MWHHQPSSSSRRCNGASGSCSPCRSTWLPMTLHCASSTTLWRCAAWLGLCIAPAAVAPAALLPLLPAVLQAMPALRAHTTLDCMQLLGCPWPRRPGWHPAGPCCSRWPRSSTCGARSRRPCRWAQGGAAYLASYCTAWSMHERTWCWTQTVDTKAQCHQPPVDPSLSSILPPAAGGQRIAAARRNG